MKKVAPNAKSCSKVAEHNRAMPSRGSPMLDFTQGVVDPRDGHLKFPVSRNVQEMQRSIVKHCTPRSQIMWNVTLNSSYTSSYIINVDQNKKRKQSPAHAQMRL